MRRKENREKIWGKVKGREREVKEEAKKTALNIEAYTGEGY